MCAVLVIIVVASPALRRGRMMLRPNLNLLVPLMLGVLIHVGLCFGENRGLQRPQIMQPRKSMLADQCINMPCPLCDRYWSPFFSQPTHFIGTHLLSLVWSNKTDRSQNSADGNVLLGYAVPPSYL